MDPLVSIIIPVYNGANYMREAIDSALAQTYSNVEIIVVNDGSNDGSATREIALSYGEKIRYFEKENGGVSTALNLGIKNMRGQYFSWLSHDDLYLPEKVQVEIDTLRQVGDMFRIVCSNWSGLRMPERGIVELKLTLPFRQEFLETGTLALFFQLIQGCTLLIPKIYFDIYGGFDETFRAVQDYKKFFEIFRGKRLVYLRKPLVFYRFHAQQTSYQYSMTTCENEWLYAWMIYNMTPDDLVGSGLTDMYHFYSAAFTKWIYHCNGRHSNQFAVQKLMELPESPNAEEHTKILNDAINDDNYETFLPKEEENILRQDFAWRGVNLGSNVKFIPFKQFSSVKPAQNVRLLNRDLLMQVLVDTPIRKNIFAEWLRSQGGQRA